MFDPKKAKANKEEKAAKAKAIKQVREWSLAVIPQDCLIGLNCDVREV
jgi:tRNA A37 threonylcarbamoyladenosine synthetase subunit TsaC/SUA5/YrdC